MSKPKQLEDLDNKMLGESGVRLSITYPLMMAVLSEVKDDPSLEVLGNLALVLDQDNLIKFLQIFQGTTITIPTIKDYKDLIKGMDRYMTVHVKGGMEQTFKHYNKEDDKYKEISDKIDEIIKSRGISL